MPKVLFVLTSYGIIPGTEKTGGWYAPELIHPYAKFSEAGYEISIASINGGDTTVSGDSVNLADPEIKKFWEDSSKLSLTKGTPALSSFKGSDFDV
jgi:putative intracellular protease/amidase